MRETDDIALPEFSVEKRTGFSASYVFGEAQELVDLIAFCAKRAEANDA